MIILREHDWQIEWGRRLNEEFTFAIEETTPPSMDGIKYTFYVFFHPDRRREVRQIFANSCEMTHHMYIRLDPPGRDAYFFRIAMELKGSVAKMLNYGYAVSSANPFIQVPITDYWSLEVPKSDSIQVFESQKFPFVQARTYSGRQARSLSDFRLQRSWTR